MQLEEYVELLKGKVYSPELADPTRTVKSFLIQAIDYTEYHADGQIPSSGPWELDDRVVRKLRRCFSADPPGGWNNLVRIAAGAGYFRVINGAFKSVATVDDVAQIEAEKVRRHLFEAFSRTLIPPASAAGLFLLLNLHPVWGLRLARMTQRRLRATLDRYESHNVSPDQLETDQFDGVRLGLARELVFDCLAALFGVLRSLDADGCYRTADLAAVLSSASESIRRRVRAKTEELPPGRFPVFIGEQFDKAVIASRVRTFIHRDLFDAVLIPTRLVECSGEGSFQVRPHLFDGLVVGDMSREEQRRRLGDLLHIRSAAKLA